MFTAVGVEALTNIKNDFVLKGDGKAGEDGVTWKPLSKEYLAYQRRFGPNEKSDLKKAAGLGGAHRFAPGGKKGLLNAQQLKHWRAIFRNMLARFVANGDPLDDAKAHAAAIAWIVVKRHGAKTMLEVFGNRKVQILKDTGVLLNSISPGKQINEKGDYEKPQTKGGGEQIFDWMKDGIIVGTNVAYAGYHQHGKNARPFLPKGALPQIWADRILAVGMGAIALGIQRITEQHRP